MATKQQTRCSRVPGDDSEAEAVAAVSAAAAPRAASYRSEQLPRVQALLNALLALFPADRPTAHQQQQQATSRPQPSAVRIDESKAQQTRNALFRLTPAILDICDAQPFRPEQSVQADTKSHTHTCQSAWMTHQGLLNGACVCPSSRSCLPVLSLSLVCLRCSVVWRCAFQSGRHAALRSDRLRPVSVSHRHDH